MSEVKWYGIANSSGGYTFSQSKKALCDWKALDGIKGYVEDVTDEHDRLSKDDLFHEYNDHLTDEQAQEVADVLEEGRVEHMVHMEEEDREGYENRGSA